LTLAQFYSEQQHWEAALAVLEKAIQQWGEAPQDPPLAHLRWQYAMIMGQRNQFEQALQELGQIQPELLPAQDARGMERLRAQWEGKRSAQSGASCQDCG
jgi:predicted negative regulator of RcsB-dependent stress response